MPHSMADRSTLTLTSARGPALNALAADGLIVREVGVFSTVAVECRIRLARITALGAGGAALDEIDWDANFSIKGTGTNTPTADHTVVAGNIRMVTLPATIGAGFIWTFGGRGLVIPEGTGNGIAILLPGGTAQVVDFHFDWE